MTSNDAAPPRIEVAIRVTPAAPADIARQIARAIRRARRSES